MSADDQLFAAVPASVVEATDTTAWLAAMLAVECALSAAEEDVGVVPAGTARAVAAAAVALPLDIDALASAGVEAGTPVIPLVAALTDAAGPWVHYGATSQDVMDTALALVARRATAAIGDLLRRVAAELTQLADKHRHTVMAGRTLLQQGAPTTFGVKAAGWLAAAADAADGLDDATNRVPLQLGGPVGTLAVLGDRAPAVVALTAERLALTVPVMPWHSHRAPVARLAAALGIVAGVVAKIAGDLILLAQNEVAEVAERAAPGRGTSSAMAHKRNPVASVRAVAAARRAQPLAAALAATLDHEHERAAGAWQAEAPMLTDLYRHAGNAVDAVADALYGLEVNEARMRANLDERGGWAAEAVTAALAPTIGRDAARAVARDPLAAIDGPHGAIVQAILDDPLGAAGPVDWLIDGALARAAQSSVAP